MNCECGQCGKQFEAVPQGGHRVVCGDSTLPEVRAVAVGSEEPVLCLTDPPYGLGDTASNKNEYDQHDDTLANLEKLIAAVLPAMRKLCKVVVLTPGNGNSGSYPRPTWTMAWFTPAGVGSGPWGFCCWQPILCYGKDPKLARKKGRHPDAVVHTESSEKNGHPCPKPVNFWSWLMERTSEPGDVLFEQFLGSGTTLISAEKLGRRVLAVELSPAYVDLSVLRWQQFTGRTAIHERNGRCFSNE